MGGVFLMTLLGRRAPRALFFGMDGSFSTPSLAALLESGIEVCAVVLPASPVPGAAVLAIQQRKPPRAARPSLPMLNAAPSIVKSAWTRGIPVWDVYSLRRSETVETLAAYQPDVICVACFSRRIPRAILDLPRLGCLNVHPSLLPANRGPMPLFWTFREDSAITGVTIHLMDERMDSGDILAQEAIAVPDGISYQQLEAQCAASGGVLLARSVWELYQKRALRIPQDETKSSYRPSPGAEDYIVPADEWSARHVYNFIRGVAPWNGPLELRVAGQAYLVRGALSYSHNDVGMDVTGESDAHSHSNSGELVVRCKVGYCSVLEYAG
jgi:methionyl-tRNA formyltransferase